MKFFLLNKVLEGGKHLVHYNWFIKPFILLCLTIKVYSLQKKKFCRRTESYSCPLISIPNSSSVPVFTFKKLKHKSPERKWHSQKRILLHSWSREGDILTTEFQWGFLPPSESLRGIKNTPQNQSRDIEWSASFVKAQQEQMKVKCLNSFMWEKNTTHFFFLRGEIKWLWFCF